MNWMTGWGCITKQSRCSTLKRYMTMENDQSRILYVKKGFLNLYQPSGYPSERNLLSMAKLPHYFMENAFWCKSASKRCLHNVQNDSDLSRDIFVRLWAADSKQPKPSKKGKHKVLRSGGTNEATVNVRNLFQSLEKTFSGVSVMSEKSYNKAKSDLKQPPTSQSVTGILKPISSEEVRFLSS